MPDFSIENSFQGIVAGIDEVGYGSFVGPVVSAVVCFPDKTTSMCGIDDSKKLTRKKREELFEKIICSSEYAIGISSVEEINDVNILQATKLSVTRAIENLKIKVDFLIIDGIQTIETYAPMHSFKKGDGISTSIAAASIVAKVFRDRMMDQLHELHPKYAWNQNKGYGTAQHINAIKTFGVTDLHRKKFVRSLLTEDQNKKENI